jgi:hypothetical protein
MVDNEGLVILRNLQDEVAAILTNYKIEVLFSTLAA